MRVLGMPLRIGVIGMGAGTIAGYGLPGDVIRFYEIDPDIVGLSQGPKPWFTYVKDAPAHVEIATGDARIVMQQELAGTGSQKFDVLAVDAFSGDAVPVHLLTREAMKIYLQHLRTPGSVIAFHVSNRSIDLRPVIAGLAQEYHLASLEISPPDISDWILLSADPAILEIPSLATAGHAIELDDPAVLWTDDHSDLYSLLRSW
jgi:spermidine synthase